ncbi:MAG: hypothetical protein MZV65_31670 [Chromatiales bacterium]|nr:hypothetical protein [Chromatiales bacterium]
MSAKLRNGSGARQILEVLDGRVAIVAVDIENSSETPAKTSKTPQNQKTAGDIQALDDLRLFRCNEKSTPITMSVTVDARRAMRDGPTYRMAARAAFGQGSLSA